LTLEGRTPLHYAIQTQNESVVSLLIENGADPTLKMEHKISPLELAILNQSFEILHILKTHESTIKFKRSVNPSQKKMEHLQIGSRKGIERSRAMVMTRIASRSFLRSSKQAVVLSPALLLTSACNKARTENITSISEIPATFSFSVSHLEAMASPSSDDSINTSQQPTNHNTNQLRTSPQDLNSSSSSSSWSVSALVVNESKGGRDPMSSPLQSRFHQQSTS